MSSYPIRFSPYNVIANDETFIPITQDKIQNIAEGQYMISNYGRIFDQYLNVFVPGYLNGDFMYVNLYGINGIISIPVIDLIARMFYEQNNPYSKLIDRNSRVVFHKDNIEWTNISEEEQNKNIVYRNNQRVYVGERSSLTAKLNTEKVHKICKLLVEDKHTLQEIGDMFGVGKDAIYRIKARKNWKHISKDYDFPEVISERKGENNPKAKYKESDIRKICELLEENKYTNKEIAAKVNVENNLITRIKCKNSWTDISKEYNIPDMDRSNPINTQKKPDYMVKDICRLLEKNKYNLREIADITNVSYNFVWNVKNRKIRTDISKDYNF